MKRYFRIQVAVLCLIAIICGVNSSHVSAKMSNRTVHKKYMTTLLKLNKQLTEKWLYKCTRANLFLLY